MLGRPAVLLVIPGRMKTFSPMAAQVRRTGEVDMADVGRVRGTMAAGRATGAGATGPDQILPSSARESHASIRERCGARHVGGGEKGALRG
jgi:hypothetical protein